ncbi:MAG: MFS transporter [Desulfobacterales bacterium]|nr:MFS transporter [Desulfobacterales bacterium]
MTSFQPPENNRPVPKVDHKINCAEVPERFTALLTPLLLLTSIFFVNFISRIALAPLMPKVKAELALSHAEAGSLFLMISLGYFATLLASGFISSHITHRRTIMFSSMAMGAALITTSFSTGIWGMRVGLILLGMAAGPYMPSGMATMTTLFHFRHWGKALAIHELAPNFSFILAPFVAEVVMYWFSWRTVFLVLGVVAFILAAVFARYGRGGEFRGESIKLSSLRQLLSRPAFWIMVVLFSLGISSTLGVYTMLPLYLVTDHGLDRNWANTLIAFSRIAGLGVALIGGWATDRFGPLKILRIVFALAGLLTILIGLTPQTWVAVAIFVQPIIAVCFFPAGLAALSMVSSASERNLTVSLTIPLAFLMGGGAAPALIGFIGDMHSFGWGIVLVGGLILTGSIFSGFVKLRDQGGE